MALRRVIEGYRGFGWGVCGGGVVMIMSSVFFFLLRGFHCFP